MSRRQPICPVWAEKASAKIHVPVMMSQYRQPEDRALLNTAGIVLLAAAAG